MSARDERTPDSAEKAVRDIRSATRRRFLVEDPHRAPAQGVSCMDDGRGASINQGLL